MFSIVLLYMESLPRTRTADLTPYSHSLESALLFQLCSEGLTINFSTEFSWHNDQFLWHRKCYSLMDAMKHPKALSWEVGGSSLMQEDNQGMDKWKELPNLHSKPGRVCLHCIPATA